MSQNTDHLLLFFADQTRHETAVRAVLELSRGELARSAELQAQLGIDLTTPWTERWFNQDFSAQPEFLRLSFDTSSSEALPLQLLTQLFQGGLRAAVLEVFHSQVCETERHYFHAGHRVSPEAFYQAEPEIGQVVEAQLGEDEEDFTGEFAEPASLKQLLAEQKANTKLRDETVQAIVELADISRKTGSNPLDVARSVLVLRGLLKGVLQALAFTLVTVLLFKGLWLWIGLGVVLLVALPLYYASQANKL